jgi:hypothetical protein
MYIPQGTNRLDGAYFGSSLAHIFFQTYHKNIVLPPKVYFYEPSLYGFHIAGKRGSKYFAPQPGPITDTNQRQQRIEAEMHAGSTRAVSAQQGSSVQHKVSPAVPAQPASNNQRKNKSRHKGKKN